MMNLSSFIVQNNETLWDRACMYSWRGACAVWRQ